jgi:hypothetical protein
MLWVGGTPWALKAPAQELRLHSAPGRLQEVLTLCGPNSPSQRGTSAAFAKPAMAFACQPVPPGDAPFCFALQRNSGGNATTASLAVECNYDWGIDAA